MGQFINAKTTNVDSSIDKVLAAFGIEVSEHSNRKSETKDFRKENPKWEEKHMESKNIKSETTRTAKKPFEANLDGHKYVVKRCYTGTDGKMHVAPEQTFLAFVEVTDDGKAFPIKAVEMNSTDSWFKQLLLAIVDRLHTKRK